MKYSETKSRIKDLLEAKYGDEWSDHYRIEEWESAFVLSKRNDESQLFSFVLWVSKEEQGWIGTKNLGRSEKSLADICMELALTPLEEREEEKKYVVKVWKRAYNSSIIVKDRINGLLDISTTDAVDALNRQADEPSYQVAFTKKEIDRLKDIVTLNIDWNKAVEEYDGEI